MAELSSRERVLRAVHGKDVDRTPRLFRAEAPVRDAITKAKGFADIYALYDHYGIDTQHIPVIYDKTKEVPCNFRDVHDANYIREFPFPGEGYVNVGDSLKIAESASASGRAVVGGVWASLFTHSRGLIGEERFLCSIYDEPELIEALVTWVTDMYISWNEQYLKACGKYIDIYYFGSDFGTQGSMFVSEEHYVRFFKENMRRIVASAKKYVDVVMFHTCGSVFDIIGHLIDIGVDILDPVQTGANKMQPGMLAKNYKGKICFHGAVSTQKILPFGTTEEVCAHVKDIIETLGPSGLVIGPDQDMIGHIPVENVDAMYGKK